MSMLAAVPVLQAAAPQLLAQALPALPLLLQRAGHGAGSAALRSVSLRHFAAQPTPSSNATASILSQDDHRHVRNKDKEGSGDPAVAQAQAGFTPQPHPGIKAELSPSRESYMEHPIYTPDYVERVKPVHVKPAELRQHIGLLAIRLMRWTFDKATGYTSVPGAMTEAKWLQRIIFLETVAGVPGMVAGMQRHLKSLRSMKRDNGWIHTLLEEAENERMHLLTFFELRKPGPLFRAMVILAQGVFFNMYFLAYLLSPRTCHAFVGFLEEEAVKTYTHALEEIDAGRLWPNKPAPKIGIDYWRLQPGANMRDLILAVRADEACHSHVNHTFSKLDKDEVNPFASDSQSQLP